MDESARSNEQPYARLPERIRPEDMITEQVTRDPGDPTMDGRDPNWAWTIRHG